MLAARPLVLGLRGGGGGGGTHTIHRSTNDPSRHEHHCATQTTHRVAQRRHLYLEQLPDDLVTRKPSPHNPTLASPIQPNVASRTLTHRVAQRRHLHLKQLPDDLVAALQLGALHAHLGRRTSDGRAAKLKRRAGAAGAPSKSRRLGTAAGRCWPSAKASRHPQARQPPAPGTQKAPGAKVPVPTLLGPVNFAMNSSSGSSTNSVRARLASGPSPIGPPIGIVHGHNRRGVSRAV